MMEAIDLSPLLDLAFEILGVIVLTLVSWVLLRLRARFNIDVDDRQRALIDDLLLKGINRARNAVPTSLDSRSEFVREAVSYVSKSAPDALKHFGIHPGTEAGKEKLSEMVLARIPAHEPDLTVEHVAGVPAPDLGAGPAGVTP